MVFFTIGVKASLSSPEVFVEVVSSRVSAAGHDPPRVAKSHVSDRFFEDRFSLGRCCLGRAVHAQHKLIDLQTIAYGAQAGFDQPQGLGQQDLNRSVSKIAIGSARQVDRIGRAGQ